MPAETPREWLDILHHQLHARWAHLRVFDAYYEGDQTLAFVTRKFRDAYGGLFRELTDNYMPLVVDAAAERLRVQGFRFGETEEADREAWRIWQANGLDAQANMVHTEAIKLGTAYWMVQPNGAMPRVTAEHPSQVIVAHAPGDRRVRLAALKEWVDGEHIYANVYLPDRVVKYRTTARQLQLEKDDRKWTTVGAVGNPLREVPVIEVPNNPSMLRGGRSDLAGGPVSLQNGINMLLAAQLIGAEYIAWPQRVLLGVDTPRDAEGRPIPNADMKASQSHLWMFPNENAKAFEFSAADLDNFRKAIDGLIGDLAAQTRIPIYYFRPAAISNLSAEALVGLDAGLVSKTDDKKDPMGESHEDMERLSFKAIDAADPRASATDAETIWRNTESRSHAQVVDAAIKLRGLLPDEMVMERIGLSPPDVDRAVAMREAEQFLTDDDVEEVPGATVGAQPSTDQ